MLIKLGEKNTFSVKNILSPKDALSDPKITKRFVKLAKKLKRLAPKASDFVYAHAIMMHAAESALIDQTTGKPVLNKKGEPVTGHFESFTNKKGDDSLRWVSNDNIKPYRNGNGDIFSEAELLKAYKKWVGKPLCKDHKSDSVDGIRGIIIDTYYDPKFKRVHALFAVDKKNYGDLARKVETGYANCVSMGTGVGRAVCTECGNVARTESEYCSCIKSRANYGEINLDLSPIELSLVVNGADQLAKVKMIVASMNQYVDKKQQRIDELVHDRCVNPTELQSLAESLRETQNRLNHLMGLNKQAASTDIGENVAAIRDALKIRQMIEQTENPKEKDILKRYLDVLENGIGAEKEEDQKWPPVSPTEMSGGGVKTTAPEDGPSDYVEHVSPADRGSITYASRREGNKQGALDEISSLRSKIESLEKSLEKLNKISKEESIMNSARLKARAKARRAYFQGGGGVNEPTPGKPKYEKDPMGEKVRDTEDKQMVGEPLETGSEGLHPGDEETLQEAGRDGLNLSKAELEERKLKRRAYFLGGGGINEPTPGTPKYDKDPMAEKVRNTEDKQMTGVYNMGGNDGMVPSDIPTKKKLLRAKLRAKFNKVADDKGQINKAESGWNFYAGDQLILSATAKDAFEDDQWINNNWDYFQSKEYAKEVFSMIRTDGFDKTAYLLKGAVGEAPQAAVPPMDLGAPAEGVPEAPMPTESEAPTDEAESDVKVEKPQDETKSKIDAALSELEEKITEIRDLTSGGTGEELVDINIDIDKDKENKEAPVEPAPMDQALAMMDASADELAIISEAFEGEVDNRMLKMARQALEDSELIIAQASDLLSNAKKEDKDEKEDKKDKKEDKKDKKEDKKDKKEDKDEDEKEDKKDKKEDKDEDEKEAKAKKLLENALKIRAQNRANLLARAGMEDLSEEIKDKATEKAIKDLQNSPADDGEEGCVECMPTDDEMEAYLNDELGFDAEEDMDDVFAARKSDRDALIAEAEAKILGKYELDLGPADNATEPKYFDAHSGGKGTVTELTHTQTPDAKVETISEVHDAMRDVAESGPRNVREAAAILQEQIVKGAMKAEDIDKLVAEGKVDSAAASYWKKYFSSAPDAGSFGADLSKEFATKKKEASDKTLEVKLRRAYDIGLEAQEKGFIAPTRGALEEYVDEIVKFDDAAFESNKRIISQMKTQGKKSGSIPVVGAEAANKPINATASAKSPNALDDLKNLWK